MRSRCLSKVQSLISALKTWGEMRVHLVRGRGYMCVRFVRGWGGGGLQVWSRKVAPVGAHLAVLRRHELLHSRPSAGHEASSRGHICPRGGPSRSEAGLYLRVSCTARSLSAAAACAPPRVSRAHARPRRNARPASALSRPTRRGLSTLGGCHSVTSRCHVPRSRYLRIRLLNLRESRTALLRGRALRRAVRCAVPRLAPPQPRGGPEARTRAPEPPAGQRAAAGAGR
jgi:hypothetical protein